MSEKAQDIVCARPSGCGWRWTFRTVKHHWWSRPRLIFYGPVFEDGNEVAARWQSYGEFRENYADCLRHLVGLPRVFPT